MTRRVLSSVLLTIAFATSVAAQDGQGANARPGATPPVRPPNVPAPSGRGGSIQRLILINPVLQTPLSAPEPQKPADDEFTKGVYKITDPGVVAPKANERRNASYTPAALQAKIQGTVGLEAVVMPDGSVGRTRIVQSLDKSFGLDEAALDAVKQWTFDPGTLNGQPVPVLVRIEMQFVVR